MRRPAWTSLAGILAIAFGLAAWISAAPSGRLPQAATAAVHPVVLNFDASASKVHYTVDSTLHTVHGTFNVKSGTIQFDPQTGRAEGEIIVYATSGESGNSSRDERMHKEILETWKYQEATFRLTQIDGQVSLTSPSDFKVKGIVNLHGADHEVIALVHSEFTGDHWKGTAKFDVPYIKWGIKDPSNFLLKVKPVVNIELDMAGTQSAAK
jgi:polyisoprenoid-binding protein YceI